MRATAEDQVVIRIASAEELAVTIPYQLGFRPQRSIVVVALHGTRLGGIARVDLPDPEDAAALAESTFRTLAARAAPDAVLLLAYEDEAGEATPVLVTFAEVALRDGLAVAGVQAVHDRTITEILVHRGRRAGGRVLATCGPSQSLPDASRVPAVADFVALGSVALPSREALAALLEPDGRGREVAEALGLLRGRRPARGCALRLWGRHLRSGVRPGGGLPARDIARMVSVLADRGVRDSLLAWLCPGLIDDHELDPECRRLIRQHLPARAEGAAGERAEAGAHQALLLTMVRATPDDAPGAAADICAVLAQQAWARGDCALAQIAAERALEHEPGHVLAALLLQLAAAGVPPDGLRRARVAHVADT